MRFMFGKPWVATRQNPLASYKMPSTRPTNVQKGERAGRRCERADLETAPQFPSFALKSYHWPETASNIHRNYHLVKPKHIDGHLAERCSSLYHGVRLVELVIQL